MKDSGIEWIGSIPEHWEVKPLKWDFDIIAGATPKTDNANFWDGNIPWITPADYKTEDRYISQGRRNLSEEGMASCATTLLPKGSIIFSKRAPIGLVVINSQPLCTNQGCIGCVPKKDDARYYYYTMSIFTEQYELFGSGTTFKEISASNFADFRLPHPSLTEQQAIADYLDEKCAEVDEMIALQEQIIEELKAYKQSVITEAVTKGLNPAAPMRDSGIEWIGQIPEHWEVKRIKFIGKAENGLTYTPNDVCDESEGTLVLRSSNIQDGKLAFNDNVYVRSVPDSLKVRVGDIIICSRNGSASLVGKSALVEDDIDASFGAFMMRFRSSSNSKYIHFLLTATISHYKQLFTTTTINQLTIGLINNIAMPFIGNAVEQQAIADYLDEKCADIDSLIQTKQQKIDSLKEYKKSIIYEYVTGKREVEL
ncbi:MAG: restriction endonuclease subunit S [Bacteroidaceae bacterium]|nr:restriction endonuclease subunit S [Bacteroidaceae bacterium]